MWAYRLRSIDPVRAVQDLVYHTTCTTCSEKFDFTIRELNQMVKKGDATAEPGQMRQFKCPSCSNLTLLIDAGVPTGREAVGN
jgi:hypothetical protein